MQNAVLHAIFSDKFIAVFSNKPAILGSLLIEKSPRIGGGQGDLNGLWIDFLCVSDGLFDRFSSLTGEANNEGAVDQNAELVAVTGKLLGL